MLVDSFMLIAIPVVCGLLIGLFSGLLGIGGGTLMIPVFRLLFDMSPTMCTATSLFAIIPTSFSGTTQHVRNKTCVLPVALAAGIGGGITSPVGVWLAQRSPSWLIMLAAAGIIGYTAISMLYKALRNTSYSGALQGYQHLSDAQQRSNIQQHVDAQQFSDAQQRSSVQQLSGVLCVLKRLFRVTTPRQLGIAVCIGMAAGVASGFVGVGGGFLMVPLFLSVLGFSMKQASGTSLAAVMVLALPGVVFQALLGNINYFAGIAIVCGTIPGAFLGARLAHRVPDRTLRIVFGIFLLFGSFALLLNEYMSA